MTPLSILFMAPRLPWPLDTGGKIRTYHLLRALAAHHRVRLLTFRGEESGAEGLAAMDAMGVETELFDGGGLLRRAQVTVSGLLGPMPLNVRKYWCPAMARRVVQAAAGGEADLVHCDHLHMAPYGPLSGLPFVLDEHNVETKIWQRFSRDGSEPLAKRLVFAQQALWLRRLEVRLSREADLTLLCSEADGDTLRNLAPGQGPTTRLVPNGVDVAYFAEPGPSEHGGHIFFTGSMDWAPNDNAVINFLDEIWPEMRRRLPELSFVVVGRNPSNRLRARHGSARVTVTGTVPDVRPHMRGALALVVPMRVGGGTRLKILEAFAAGVPVVSTPLGIEGIEAEPGVHYLQAETPVQFADAVAALRDDPGQAEKLARTAAELVQQRYSWEAIGQALAEDYARRFSPRGR